MSQEQNRQIPVESGEEKEFIAKQNNNNSVCISSARGPQKRGLSQQFHSFLKKKKEKIKIGAQKFQPSPPPKKKAAASAITYFEKTWKGPSCKAVSSFFF